MKKVLTESVISPHNYRQCRFWLKLEFFFSLKLYSKIIYCYLSFEIAIKKKRIARYNLKTTMAVKIG